MSRPTSLEAAARAAYAAGANPVAFTEDVLCLLAAYTFDLADGDPELMRFTRRLLAALMDMGWTMPAGSYSDPEAP